MVEAVEPGGLAERGGLRANDVILAVNGIDVEQKSHRYLTEFLQSYSSHPILEVNAFRLLISYLNESAKLYSSDRSIKTTTK